MLIFSMTSTRCSKFLICNAILSTFLFIPSRMVTTNWCFSVITCSHRAKSSLRELALAAILYAVVYVRVSCFVVRGCAVSRRYINVCNCDMFSVV